MLDTILQSTSLPNLHPAIVHFPIAAVPLALAFEFAGLVLIQRRWLAHAATTLFGFAALAAWVAVWAGERAADGLTDVPAKAQPLVGEHSDWGHWALYCLIAVALVRLALHAVEKTTDHRGARFVSLALGLLAFGVVFKTADLGGGLVYEHGLGVQTRYETETETEIASEAETEGGHAEESADHSDESGSARDRLIEEPDGSLVWRPAASDQDALGEVLTAVPGSSSELVSWTEGQEDGLTLRIDGSTTLVLPGTYSDVQVEARLVLVDWQGTVGVAHHVDRQGTGAHDMGAFTLSGDGTATLFDIRQGERRELDTKQVEVPAGSLNLAVSSAGRHLKGLLGGAVATHGHVAAGPAGACGLIFDGTGLVRIEEVKVIPLE